MISVKLLTASVAALALLGSALDTIVFFTIAVKSVIAGE